MNNGTTASAIVLLACTWCLDVQEAAAPSTNKAPTLPIPRRSFLLGTAAVADKSHNPAVAYARNREVGELTMYWVTPNGIGLYQRLAKLNPVARKTNYEVIKGIGLIPVVNLNPWTVQPGKGIVRNDGSGQRDFSDPGFLERMKQEACQIASHFTPAYFSIGNEVNSVYELLGAEQFRHLAAVEKGLYATVKAASPNTQVIVVLSYSQLVDLPGAPRFKLIEDLEGAYDILGITTYPWKNYASPEELPKNYYSRLTRCTRKPIGFTEIAWSSDAAHGGSEQKQVAYLLRFLELTKGMNLAFVNWAFLHDLPETSVTGFIIQKTHLGLGLRRYDGTPKDIWDYFRVLYQLPK